jgi:hypothetical protein
VEEEQAEKFYDVMDGLPTFWQINDAPSQHMLTRHVPFISTESSIALTELNLATILPFDPMKFQTSLLDQISPRVAF